MLASSLMSASETMMTKMMNTRCKVKVARDYRKTNEILAKIHKTSKSSVWDIVQQQKQKQNYRKGNETTRTRRRCAARRVGNKLKIIVTGLHARARESRDDTGTMDADDALRTDFCTSRSSSSNTNTHTDLEIMRIVTQNSLPLTQEHATRKHTTTRSQSR